MTSLSFRSGDIRTQYYIATSNAFQEDSSECLMDLASTKCGKYGHLQSVMSTPVSGSVRLVCAPHNDPDPRVIFISNNLASKIMFCTVEEVSPGVTESIYSERTLIEGDYVVLERAPSLSKYNIQPLRVLYWGEDCMRIHTKVFSYFHRDYDRDEGHIYALGNFESIQ
ncbi:hypothetical protein N0V93_010355 [Gnomoniopsis smithogilvyi]|uniref:RNA polymerase alpha subunit domain-containing protein n=1 Tax=Gnomoniopsis smithogilvyi TaxID=1191159 RepID=A0A9W8YHP2_9PEZI|nr:hypothetical protein N0V93_010355 [Gnomoniopsis smithogilvyi]